jgi:hypothetical protein
MDPTLQVFSLVERVVAFAARVLIWRKFREISQAAL